MSNPRCKFEDGKLWYLSSGIFIEDEYGFDSMFFLHVLKSVPEEHRTEQDKRFIKEIQDALRARRAHEESEK